MNIPIPLEELEFEGEMKKILIPKCVRKTYDYRQNYYFGINAKLITSAEQLTSYR